MYSHILSTSRERRGFAAVSRSVFAAGLLIACGCSSLTDVDAPDLVQRGALTNSSGAVTFFNGAVSSFYSMFGTAASNTNAIGAELANAGLLSDELTATSTYSGMTNADQHNLPEARGSIGAYTFLQQTRGNQLQALAVLQQSLPSERWRIGEVYGLMAHVEVLLAETICSGVPLSSIGSDFAPQFGGPLTTTQLLERALQDFDSAAVYGADSARILNMALVGQGHVLLDLDRPAEASAAVTNVPTSFVFITEHAAAVTPNNLVQNMLQGIFGMADNKGMNGLDYVSANDPRINPVLVGPGIDGTPVYRPARLASQASPNILTSGVEARLIEAEALLWGEDAPGALTILNQLRATVITPAMPPLTLQTTKDAQVDQLFRERAFWLYLTGHRFGDMRRLVRQYGRAVDAVFPTGPYKYGGNFGTDIMFPIDQAEITNNPLMNNKGCIDRNP